MRYRELDSLLVYEFLKNFALSLIGVFIPVYIVSEGMGLLAAASFIGISALAGIALSYPASRVISRKGFKHGLAGSYLFLVPGLLTIRVLELSYLTIAASAVLYSTGKILHSISLNSEFAVDSSDSQRAEDSGKMLSLPSLSRIIAPVVGGAVFAGLGFTELLGLTLLVLAASVVPLALSREHRDPMDYEIRKLLEQEYLRTVPLFMARGIQAVTAVAIFGLFVFTQVGGSLDVGAARALDSLGFVATGLLVGRYASRKSDRAFVLAGCAGSALAYIFRGLVSTPLQVFAVSLLGGVFFQMYHVPVYSRFADEAEKTEILEFYTLRKAFFSAGQLLAAATLITSYILYGQRAGFLAAFLLAAAATLTMAAVYLSSPDLN